MGLKLTVSPSQHATRLRRHKLYSTLEQRATYYSRNPRQLIIISAVLGQQQTPVGTINVLMCTSGEFNSPHASCCCRLSVKGDSSCADAVPSFFEPYESLAQRLFDIHALPDPICRSLAS